MGLQLDIDRPRDGLSGDVLVGRYEDEHLQGRHCPAVLAEVLVRALLPAAYGALVEPGAPEALVVCEHEHL